MGGSGASTPQAKDETSQQVYAPWFNDLQKQFGGVMSNQLNQYPALQQEIQAGGTPVAAGQNIWGQPQQQPVAPMQPMTQPVHGAPTQPAAPVQRGAL